MPLFDATLTILQGLSHGVLFAVFGIAAIGKLLGCRRGVGTLCTKAAGDVVCALLGLLPFQAPMLLAGGLALAIGGGGWLIEVVRKNSVCRCFGVMNGAFHRYRNPMRLALAMAGALLLLRAWRSPGPLADLMVACGMVVGLATALLLASQALGAAMLGNKPIRIAAPEADVTPAVALAFDQFAGILPDGQSTTLGQLLRPGQPLAILFSMPGCPQCDVVKAELAPFRAHLPFPLRIVDNGKRRSEHADLSDQDGLLRRQLAIHGLPTLVVFDATTMAVAAPFASGPEAIRRQVMRLLVRPAAVPIHH